MTSISEFEDQLELMSNIDPALKRYWDRISVKSYDDFLKILYADLDDIIALIQENRELRHNDSEDRITVDIVTSFKQWGYNASHETKIGGHVDIYVQRKKFKWMSEAKIYNGPAYILKGFNQLCTRYTTGDVNQDNGGILIYFKNQGNVKEYMDKWKNHLQDSSLPNFSCYPCNDRSLSFFSNHTHGVSGTNFVVKHIPVLLFFDPQDRSSAARNN